MILDHIILFLAWSFYFAIHSLLASNRVKAYVKSVASRSYGYYRLFYNFIAIVGFLLIMLWSGTIATTYWYDQNKWSMAISLTITTAGVLVVRSAFRHYRLSEFLGIKKTENPQNQLITSGILSKVRHPLYSGTLLIVIGFLVYLPNLTNLITCCTLFIYLYFGIKWEEAKLVDQFGKVYLDYRKRVPMLIPKFVK